MKGKDTNHHDREKSHDKGETGADATMRSVSTAIVLGTFVFSTYTFINNNLYQIASQAANALLRGIGLSLGFEPIFAITMAAIAFLCTVNPRRLSKILSMSWIMFFPSILYFSRFDWLTLFNSPFNFTLFSSSLPSYVILANGLVLAVGSMMLRSFLNLSGVRETLLRRGALRPEVDSVLHRNALFIATIVAVSAGAAASTAAIAPLVKPVITDMARPSAYSYLILALLAILAISVTPTTYLLRRSSKSQPIA